MNKLIVEQLTIFETLDLFDETKAYWKRSSDLFCAINGFISERVYSPDESDYRSSGSSVKTKMFYYELWEHHVFAIWSFYRSSKITWDDACKILVTSRENKTPIGMNISLDLIEWFKLTQVAEYLK